VDHYKHTWERNLELKKVSFEEHFFFPDNTRKGKGKKIFDMLKVKSHDSHLDYYVRSICKGNVRCSHDSKYILFSIKKRKKKKRPYVSYLIFFKK
jgi:hypothetical protein